MEWSSRSEHTAWLVRGVLRAVITREGTGNFVVSAEFYEPSGWYDDFHNGMDTLSAQFASDDERNKIAAPPHEFESLSTAQWYAEQRYMMARDYAEKQLCEAIEEGKAKLVDGDLWCAYTVWWQDGVAGWYNPVTGEKKEADDDGCD